MSEELAVGFIDQSGGKSTFEINFGDLKNKAAEMFDASPSNQEPEPITEKPAAVAKQPVADNPLETRVKGAETGQGTAPKTEVEAPAVVDEVVDTSDATEKQLSSLEDDALVSVPVDGVDQVMTWKEAKAGFSRTSKFTQSMQKLAQEKQQFQGELQSLNTLKEERAGLENFLKSPQAILNYVLKEFGPDALQALQGPAQLPVPDGTNPDEIVTYREAQAIAQRQYGTLQQQIQDVVNSVQGQITNATKDIENRQATAKHAVVVTSTLNDIFTTNPVLNSIPNAADLIRYEVYKLAPQTEVEAVQAFKDVAQGMVEDIGKHFKAQQKITKVAQVKAKLESKSIEPSGGAPATIQPTSFKNNDGSVNWKKVTEMAKNF